MDFFYEQLMFVKLHTYALKIYSFNLEINMMLNSGLFIKKTFED